MKTLKFMLAAATAIGLASATQADVQDYNSTGFERLAVGTNVTTGVIEENAVNSYFWYAGSVAEDNESVIAEGTPNIARPRGASAVDAGRDKILQVSTGTDPLMRTYVPLNGSAPQNPSPLQGTDVYVDTLVQFTVTPYTDTVTPGDSDKLMIYLKESVETNEFGEITSVSTNLVVVGGYMVEDGVFEPKEYKVTGVNIEPNTWHRLTVKVIANYCAIEDYEHPAFLIYLDGDSDPCVLDDLAIAEDETATGYVAPFDDDSLTLTELDEKNLVFSLKCNSQTAATLQGVGFAGEGKVDDIVFSTVDPFATVFDFTFAFGSGVSAVTYTVGGTEYDQARTFPEVVAGTEVEITSITYADDKMADAVTAVNMREDGNNTFAVTNAGASLTITAKEAYASANGEKYDSLQDAVAATAAGGTLAILQNCEINGPITFYEGITVSNDYTVSINTYYALRMANGTTTPVTFCGTGSYVWNGGSGSPILVGCNELKAAKAAQGDPIGITNFYAGSFVLNGNTLTSTDATAKAGNLVKLEDGTFVLNDGTVNGGSRGVKADSEKNNATCVLTINGGTIVNTNSAAIAATTAGGGSSTVVVNGGTFTGVIDGTGMVTIPGLVNGVANTAKFDRDQSAFCESGYETVLSEGWYVVQAAAPSGEELEPGEQSSTTYDSQAAAEAAAANVTIAASDAVTNALDSAAQATYLANFEAKVVSAGEGQYKVEVALTTAAETALQAQANADAAEVIDDLSEASVTLTTTPGFYYSFEYGTTLSNMAEVGTRTLATGTTLELTRPTTVGATAGFYKVLINVAPAAVTP